MIIAMLILREEMYRVRTRLRIYIIGQHIYFLLFFFVMEGLGCFIIQ